MSLFDRCLRNKTNYCLLLKLLKVSDDNVTKQIWTNDWDKDEYNYCVSQHNSIQHNSTCVGFERILFGYCVVMQCVLCIK